MTTGDDTSWEPWETGDPVAQLRAASRIARTGHAQHPDPIGPDNPLRLTPGEWAALRDRADEPSPYDPIPSVMDVPVRVIDPFERFPYRDAIRAGVDAKRGRS